MTAILNAALQVAMQQTSEANQLSIDKLAPLIVERDALVVERDALKAEVDKLSKGKKP